MCGDFNINLLKNEPSSNKLFDQLATAGLCVVNGITPTRYANNSPSSLLDYFITCDLLHILKFDQAATYEYRDFKSLNVNSLYSHMSFINWNECWFLSTVDNKLDFLNRNLSSLFNVHVPLRSVNVLNSSYSWYNSKVRSAIKKRNKFYTTRKWRKNLTDTSWRRYKEIRNETTAIIREAKRKTMAVDNIPKLWIGTSSLSFTDKVKNLGFILNSKLTCTDHINRVVGNVYATLRKLRISTTFTPAETRRKLVLQLIMPLITYSEVVYSKLDSVSYHKLNVAFNNATRYIYGIGRYEHISAWRTKILDCSLENYLSARNCIFMCKLILSYSSYLAIYQRS